ncbi:hypothetical protein ILYODFUR_037769, partial [Ilyodon furcidens]
FKKDSPLREDSSLSSLYGVSANSPEDSLSSLFPPSSRHWIYEESPDRKMPDDDDDHMMSSDSSDPEGETENVKDVDQVLTMEEDKHKPTS